MAAPVSSVRSESRTTNWREREEEARACLPRPADTLEEQATEPGVAQLVRTARAPEPRVTYTAAIPEALGNCSAELLRTVITCGGMLVLTPETAGASLLAAAPCALQALSFGQCVARELNAEDADTARQTAETACTLQGGIPIATEDDVTCLIFRRP